MLLAYHYIFKKVVVLDHLYQRKRALRVVLDRAL
jgi:hypothetical protein